MDAAVEHLVHTCATCQKCKLTAVKKYGKISLPTNQHIGAWEEVHVDLIGPWDVRYNSSGIPGHSTIEKIHALEFVAIQNKTSHHVALRFDGEWLCCYPRPARVIFDNGTEFTGSEFQELLSSYGIKPVPTTVRNPRSNGVIERVHLTMGDMLQTMTFSGSDWFADMQRALDAVAWAICTTVNPNIWHSPCHLAFSHDMIYRHAITLDWTAINNNHQNLLITSNTKENKSRLPQEYSPGDQILILLDADQRRNQPKLSVPTKGPFTITQVHGNGTVTINHGNITEMINIHRIKPFYH
jgi:hypothetical protein